MNEYPHKVWVIGWRENPEDGVIVRDEDYGSTSELVLERENRRQQFDPDERFDYATLVNSKSTADNLPDDVELAPFLQWPEGKAKWQ